MKEKVLAAVRNIRREQWILAGLAGMLLLVIVMPEKKEKPVEKTKAVTQAEEGDGRKEYEEQLTQALEQVDGVGQVWVAITMESTGKKIVEKDHPVSAEHSSQKDREGSESSSQSDNSQETTVYEEGSDGYQTPYVSASTYPQIRGILVVAQGGDDPVLVQQIQEAAMALFHVEAHKIKVLKMKRGERQ